MNSQEMRDKINAITRWIAYKVYPKAGKIGKFTKAYDKLVAKVLIDHNFNINDLAKASESKVDSLFDVLGNKELEMVLISARSLQKMYNDVLDNDYA